MEEWCEMCEKMPMIDYNLFVQRSDAVSVFEILMYGPWKKERNNGGGNEREGGGRWTWKY